MTATMTMQPVKSASLAEIGYDPDTKTLRVCFRSGDKYDYQNVSAEKHKSLMKAESIGRHFLKNIMPHHSWEKVK